MLFVYVGKNRTKVYFESICKKHVYERKSFHGEVFTTIYPQENYLRGKINFLHLQQIKKARNPPPQNTRNNITRKNPPRNTRKRKSTTNPTRITCHTYRKRLKIPLNEFYESFKEKTKE